MSKVFSDNIMVSIDVGTTKICVLVAQCLDNEHVEILGVGKAPSDGLSKGIVVDIAKTIHSIKSAVKEAELMAGISIESAYVGISGSHIQSINSQGVVPIKKGTVRASDIVHVIAAAQAIPIPDGQQILHVLPQYFIIDSRDKIQSPLGMYGIRLEVQAHIILGAIASVQNLIKCCEMAGVKVTTIILEQLASAQAVLSDDEQELGVAVLDIGGGTSDLAVYQKGNIRHTRVFPVAGNHFTNDIAIGLRTTLNDAERIKREYGLACMELSERNTTIEIEMVHGKQKNLIWQSKLVRIIQPRAEEMLSLVHEEVLRYKLHMFITSGLVITGGGSLLTGMERLAERILSMPVRIGMPRIEYGLPESLDSPVYATGYGLLLHALKKERSGSIKNLQGPLIKQIYLRMKSWVSDLF